MWNWWCCLYIVRVLEGNIANENNMAKWPLRKDVMCVTTDDMCSMSAVYACDNTFRLKASQQTTSSKMPAVKVADVITAA